MNVSLNVPDDLYQKVTEVAARQNVPVETVVAGALADQVRIWERFESMAAKATRESFLEALRHVPDVEPEV
jgi:predicted transcriptional regulator